MERFCVTINNLTVENFADISAEFSSHHGVESDKLMWNNTIKVYFTFSLSSFLCSVQSKIQFWLVCEDNFYVCLAYICMYLCSLQWSAYSVAVGIAAVAVNWWSEVGQLEVEKWHLSCTFSANTRNLTHVHHPHMHPQNEWIKIWRYSGPLLLGLQRNQTVARLVK